MARKTLGRLLAVTALLTLSLPLSLTAADDRCAASCADLEDAMVRLAADRLDSVLGAVADSTRALGDTYGRLAAAGDSREPADTSYWLARRTTTQGNTTGLRTWPARMTFPPAFQAPYPGFYSYRGSRLDDTVLRQLDLFEQLVPTFRNAYESFPFSWVYVTTVDEVMMIYPYVPIDQAVNNGSPTETVYYQAADFKHRAVGWTPPYLDLVGAGMMVTSSYPVYAGDKLLGVMSRDITVKQLVGSVLADLGAELDSDALIIDSRGLLIAATDPALAAELEQVNSASGAAVVYCRSAEGMKGIAETGAVASASAAINAAVEQVLARTQTSGTVRYEQARHQVLAAPITHTEWFIVLVTD